MMTSLQKFDRNEKFIADNALAPKPQPQTGQKRLTFSS